MVELLRRVDEQWMMGRLKTKEGMFPVNFIDVVEPPPDSSSPVVSLTTNHYILIKVIFQ